MLIGERPLGQAVKSFERADSITLPFTSPESKFDPGNLIGRLKKRFLKNLTHPLCIARSLSRSAIFGAPERRQTSIENFDPFPSGVLCFKQDKS